jgi:hypothetical protein
MVPEPTTEGGLSLVHSTLHGVSDLEVSEADTEGDGRGTTRRLTQLTSSTPGMDSGMSTNSATFGSPPASPILTPCYVSLCASPPAESCRPGLSPGHLGTKCSTGGRPT